MPESHIDDTDLERHYLGMVNDERELTGIEEHLMWCHSCLDRMEATERYVNAVRAGAILGDFDLELPPIKKGRGRFTKS